MKNLLLKTLTFAFLSTSLLAPALNAQCVDCPACGTEVAVGLLKKTSKSKTTFEVKQEEIAIPNICLPCKLFDCRKNLQSLFGCKCCPEKPCKFDDCPKRVREGEIKVVKVLSKKKVKCDTCQYEWKVADLEDLNEYVYDIEPATESPTPTPAEPVTAVEATIEEFNIESAPVEVEELPLMEVPAAPEMGWKNRPLFQLKKQDPVTFAPSMVSAFPTTTTMPASSESFPQSTLPQQSFSQSNEFRPTTIETPLKALPKAIKALPASTSDAFLIRKPGPRN